MSLTTQSAHHLEREKEGGRERERSSTVSQLYSWGYWEHKTLH